MIILADELPPAVTVLSKIAAAAVILLIAFRFYRVKSFLIALLVFLFTNFLFLGIIIGIYLIFKSDLIAVNNSVVYFNIGARGLLFCAFIAYLFSCIIVRLYNRRLAKDEVYTLHLENGGISVTLLAFADTGNKLREPFSNAPVIVARGDKLRDAVGGSTTRLIPASTVNQTSFLTAFKPEKLTIKTDKGEEVIENVYIALSDEMKNDCYSAVINPEILSI